MTNELLIFAIALAHNISIIIYVNAVFDYKYNRKLTNILLFIFLCCLFLATTPIINLKPLKLFIITVAQILAFKAISTNTWKEAIKKGLMLILLDLIVDFLASMIYYFISLANNSRLDIDNASKFDTLRVLSSCFCLTFFMCIILIYSLNYKKVMKEIKRKLTGILLLISLAVTFLHFVVYSYNVNTFTSLTLGFVVVSTLIFTFLAPLIYSLILKVEEYAKNEHELAFLKQKETLQLQYYKMMQEKEEEIRKINHDIKNNLQVIYGLKSESDKKNLIEKIDNNLKKYELVKYSKNDTQNVILNMKANEAKNKGIGIEITLKSSVDFMDELDISNLFSNILDNAIENIANKKKKIVLSVYPKMNYVVIKCTNTFDLENKNKPKKGVNHGFGLKIIDSIAKKYQGDKKITYQNNLFTITIILPVKK